MKANDYGSSSPRRGLRLLLAAAAMLAATSAMAQRPVVTNITRYSFAPNPVNGTSYGFSEYVYVQIEFDVDIEVQGGVPGVKPYLELSLYPQDAAVNRATYDGHYDNILILKYQVLAGDFAGPLSYPSSLSLQPVDTVIYNAATDPSDSWRRLVERIPDPGAPNALAQANLLIRTMRLIPGSTGVEAGQTTPTAWNVSRGGPRSAAMDVIVASSDPAIASIEGAGTVTIEANNTLVPFSIRGNEPGTVWITAQPAGYPAGQGAVSNQFTVIAPLNQLLIVEPLPGVAEPPYDEGTQHNWRIRRTGSISAALPVTLQVTGVAGAIAVPATVTIQAGQESATFLLRALDGGYAATLTATGTGYNQGQREINVNNVNPTITGGSVSPGTPTVGQTVFASFTAGDVAADIPKLLGSWNWGDGATTPNVLPGASVTHVYSEPGTYVVTLTVTDTDGGFAEREFEVEVNAGYALTVNIRQSGFNGLANVGTGIVTLEPPPAVTLLNTPSTITVIYPQTRGSVLVRAWPDQPDAGGYFNYVFAITGAGIAEADQLPLAGGADAASVTVQVALGQDRSVAVLFSREWMQGDLRGDVDGDGLTDEWEVFWGIDPLSAAGAAGGGGSLTGDRMPNAPAVFLPGNDGPSGPYGGPFGYPIPRTVGWQGYAPVGPLFNNILQFRGQTVAWDDADRPGTDPTVADTSGDGLTDGWLYYFWANAVNNSNFVGRAYDPNTIVGSLTISNETIITYFNPRSDQGLAGEDLWLDNDGLTTLEEYALGTNPIDWDTDGDGMPDGWEVLYTLDPLDPNDATAGVAGNPDNDYMAADGAGNIHYDVYLANAFDPRTGWSLNILEPDLTWGDPSPNTREYTNLDEFQVMRWYVERGAVTAIDPEDWPLWCTDPNLADTDADGMPDGWELYVGLNPRDTAAGREDGGTDAEGDGLLNREEFSCRGAEILYVDVGLFPMIDPGWLNKFWPTDPNNEDTDGDQIGDAAEANSSRYAVGAGAGTLQGGRCYAGGGLNPTSADTDGDFLPDYWESLFAGGFDADGARTGMDGTFGDAHDDYDKDGLVNYQEYWVGAVYHFQYDKWTSGQGYGGYDPADFFLPTRYGMTPNDWDPAYWVDQDLGIQFYYQQAEPRPGPALLYATTDPTDWDTDGDGMDDYYEMFHGLNPLWSARVDIVFKPLSLPPLVRDARVQPWQVGDQFADPDQDGIPNAEEMLAPNRPNPQSHHTDPAPLWFTDMSYSESFVNLYYGCGNMYAYWAGSGIDMIAFRPTYMFSFASNEGYDTDNDNLADKREIIGSDTPGSTDPLDQLSPFRRRALYVDGDGAARTRRGFFHGAFALRSWTVEFWMRPQQPATGSRQVIVERPVAYEPTDPLPPTELVRRTFRVGLEADGRLFAEYDNYGENLLTQRARAAGGLLTPDVWYHVAAVMDGDAKMLSLYVNGEMKAGVPTTAIPATGVVDGNPPLYRYAPIVVGAADSHPGGIVSGGNVYYNFETFSPPSQPTLHSFYRGWVDEIRIWDGARGVGQIQTSMTQAFVKDDVAASAVSTTGAARLLYHYNFSVLPDPNYEPVAPEGFAALNGRPNDGSYPGVPWWRQAADRSTVYDNYHFIPWIQNSVAHLPLESPLDSVYWGTTSTGGQTATNDFPNSANPYGYGYLHAPMFDDEVNPEFGGPFVSAGFDPAIDRLYSSLLPLRSARADTDVPLWDSGEPGNNLDAQDSDNDGIPDWWEIKYGMDPNDAGGDGSPYGDPDHDGLINLYEYLAWKDHGVALDPRNFSTVSPAGVSDYFTAIGPGMVTFGEYYDDTDLLPDGWEQQYPMAMDRYYYHRDQDPDDDEWNNEEEYLAGTDPTDPGSAPQVTVTGFIRYNGFVYNVPSVQSHLHVMAYETATMDTTPVFGAVDRVDGVYTFRFDRRMPSRTVYLFAYATGGDDWREFEAGDPYGVVGPVTVGLDGVAGIEIPMMDQGRMPWNMAFTWTRPEGVSDVFVRLTNLDQNKVVLTRWVHEYRNWFEMGSTNGIMHSTESYWQAQDYRVGTPSPGYDFTYGLPPANYKWQVSSNDLADPSAIFAFGQFNVPNTPPPAVTVVAPTGGTIVKHPRYVFKWQTDPMKPMPRFEIAIAPTNNAWTRTVTVAAPPMDATGVYALEMPVDAVGQDLFGGAGWPSGNYHWRVRSHNNATAGAWSAYSKFTIGTEADRSGMPRISGEILYYGKSATSNLIVRAFYSPDRGQGQSQGQVSMAAPGPYVLTGLLESTYKLIAFIDLNGNNVADEWEPQGMARDPSLGPSHEFRADAYAMGVFDLTSVWHVSGVRILIRDRDTDSDDLPDGWEYEHLHFSPQSTSHDAAGDLDGDGLTNLEEYALGTNPRITDSDGDGILDGDEVHVYGTDPLCADSSGDGLSDGVKVALGLNPLLRDTDGDGVSDVEELAAGSDPSDVEDARRVAIKALKPAGVAGRTAQWNTYPNPASVAVTYALQFSSNLVLWADIGELTSDGDSSATVGLTDGEDRGVRGFYRLRLEVE